MPPERKTSRSAIVNAVIQIVERDGGDAVTARTIARELGISTKPIYDAFKDIKEIEYEATKRGFEIFAQKTSGATPSEKSVKYIMFAAEHGNLFKFLFSGQKLEYDGLNDLAHKIMPGTDIIAMIADKTQLPKEKVYRLHLVEWMMLHGLAEIVSNNKFKVSESEIASLVAEVGQGMAQYYRTVDDGRA